MRMTQPIRRAQDEPGSRSPASQEAKEQGMSGHQGGPRAGQDSGTEGSSPQGSRRVENDTQHGERKGFEAGHAPSEQGRGSPRPDTIAEHQQGMKGQSGSHGAHGERSEESSTRGEPADEHVRHGRQHTPGDRPRK